MIPRQSYAPTPHSYVPNTSLAATINLDEEVKLAETRAERDLQDSLAELFSIIVTLDELEKALLKDAIPEPDYAEICERLLKQYKSILADEAVASAFGGLEEFKAEWDLEVPRATERIRIGVPLTAVSVSTSGTNAGGATGAGARPGAPHTGTPSAMAMKGLSMRAPPPPSGALILEATQEFITFLDAVKMGFLSKDQLHPLLSDVIQSVNRVTDKDFDCRGKIVQWLITLNQMRATDQLDEHQARELLMDIQQAYQGFKSTLT